MKPWTALLALAVLAAAVASAAAAAPASVQIKSCSGWRLNRLPNLKKFLKNSVAKGDFENLSVQFVPGATPKAFFLDEDGQGAGPALELRGDLAGPAVLALLAERGFEARRAPVEFGEPRATAEVGGARLEYFDTEATFDDASEFAAGRTDEQGRPGRLLTVGSAEENEEVRAWLQSGRVRARGAVWLGCSDGDKEGHWRWLHDSNPLFFTAGHLSSHSGSAGTPPTTHEGFYSNWSEREPNNAGNDEDCATFLKTGQWNDEACSQKYRVVVKYGPDAAPVASHDEL